MVIHLVVVEIFYWISEHFALVVTPEEKPEDLQTQYDSSSESKSIQIYRAAQLECEVHTWRHTSQNLIIQQCGCSHR